MVPVKMKFISKSNSDFRKMPSKTMKYYMDYYMKCIKAIEHI